MYVCTRLQYPGVYIGTYEKWINLKEEVIENCYGLGTYKEWFKIDDPKWYGIWIQQKQEENKEDQEKGRSKEVQKQLSRYH